MHIALVTKKCLARAAVLGGLTTISLALTAGSAFAQDEELEEIVVTGSRIARDANLSGALPVQTVGSEQIQMSGEFSLADIVNDIPALLSSTTSESSLESADFADGANVLNLRGLGANRTLVLVNGRRHVGGVQGSASVDVGSIPMRLVERVEVLTGGASAVYGADAVTGVVNFILQDDYEGFGIDASYGLSSEGDSQQTAITATWGTNFADDRGNIAVSVDYRVDDGLKVRERTNGALIGSARDWVNPDLRFQIGDISAGATPLFEQYFNFANTGLINYGMRVPGAQDFVDDYNGEFGTTIGIGDLSPGELALIDRAAVENAPARAVLQGRTFPFTSGFGYVIPGNAFTFAGYDTANSPDIDGNGVPDCADSYTGWFGNQAIIGGCWNVAEDGTYAPVQDGLVASGFQGFGGDSFNTINNQLGDILLPDDKITINLLGHFDISDSASIFGEIKYVTQDTTSYGGPNSFWDLLHGAPDNPFLPAFLQPIAVAAGGIGITIDPLQFDTFNTTERDTYRAVLGIEGEFNNGWNYEVSANYGRHERMVINTNSLINDRFFAAIDAVTDPATGQPACRVEVDAAAPAQNTPFTIPAYEEGYFSFTPGAGQCVPLDIWNGRPGITQAAADFVTVDQWSELIMDQFVVSAFVTGDTADFFEMPAGPIAFALGVEYRDESSDAKFDPWQRGEIPAGSVLPAGSNIADVSDNSSLTFRPQIAIRNEKGSYDVADIYLEASIPLLSDVTFARELTLDFAARLSDYSTIGQTTTWKTNLIWAPVDSLAFRGTFSEAVRAPNITELFGPQVGTTFRPVDPCDFNQIDAIELEDPTLAANFRNNCIAGLTAIGINTDPGGTGGYSFVDPLSASFGGVEGGNPLLMEETAETFTVGFVFQPDFLQGFSLTVDYWDISIEDAISAVSSQNIVDGCYQGATLNQGFCQLFTRNPDQNSPQAGGFTFLQSTSINFAKIETSGTDISVKYAFELGNHGFDITAQGTKVNELDFFTNPADLNDLNPELGEMRRPEVAGNIFLNWTFGDFGIGWQSQYQDEQLLNFLEIETAGALYGPIVTMDAFWQHDLSARWNLSDEMMLYGGIKNVTDEVPFITERAYPASARGTFFFVGLDWQM